MFQRRKDIASRICYIIYLRVTAMITLCITKTGDATEFYLIRAYSLYDDVRPSTSFKVQAARPVVRKGQKQSWRHANKQLSE